LRKQTGGFVFGSCLARRFVSWFESLGYLTPDLVVRDASKNCALV